MPVTIAPMFPVHPLSGGRTIGQSELSHTDIRYVTSPQQQNTLLTGKDMEGNGRARMSDAIKVFERTEENYENVSS
jgi:hypothetical protein